MTSRLPTVRRAWRPPLRAAGWAVAALCALLSAPLRAAEPPPLEPQPRMPVDLLAKDPLHAEGRLLSCLTVGVAANPHTGPLSAATALRAGRLPGIRRESIWSFAAEGRENLQPVHEPKVGVAALVLAAAD